MILNDKQIRALSMLPTLQPDSSWPEDHVQKHSFTGWEGDYFSTLTGEKLTPEDAHKLIMCDKPTNPVWHNAPMITPFIPGQVRYDSDGNKIVSYGTSSMGYDVRLGTKFKIFTNVMNGVIDPLNMDEVSYVDHEGDYVIIPPNSYAMGHTIEVFDIPRDILVICLGKSTYARCGAIVNVTPVEPGFKGQVVIEISNASPLPIKVHANQGIAQFLFLKGLPCETSYGDRGGKYQNQSGVQTALV